MLCLILVLTNKLPVPLSPPQTGSFFFMDVFSVLRLQREREMGMPLLLRLHLLPTLAPIQFTTTTSHSLLSFNPGANRFRVPAISSSSSSSSSSLVPRSLISCRGKNKMAVLLLLSTARSRHICKMSDSDMISQLELGRPDEKRKPDKRVNGIFWIILLNLGIFAADHWFHLREIKALYLYHNFPAWYQFVTATFCHANWNHLSSNLFFLYIFGKLVEEEEGNFGLWVSYILTGAGANLVSWLLLPRNSVSVGASGAVFGLFAISVLVKMRWDWRKILEVLILGQFVIKRVMEAAQASAGLAGGGYALQNVNHLAHLSGALIGAGLVWALSKVSPDQDVSTSSRNPNRRT